MKKKPFSVYSASAGSGKTFTIVKEYLKICLQDTNPKKFGEILAITFTNKAAKEMKARILKSLKAFNNYSSSEKTELEMMRLISKETGLELKTINKRSKLIFEAIIHNYTLFSVGTIDKFTLRLIKTFAKDLDLPKNFELNIDHKELLKQAVDLLISRSRLNEPLTQLFISFINEKMADDKSWLIENDFYEVSEELLKEASQEFTKNLRGLKVIDFIRERKKIHSFVQKIDLELSVIGDEFCVDCAKMGVLPSWILGGKNGLYKYFEYLKDKRWDKYIPSKTNLNNLKRTYWSSSKAPFWAESKISALQIKYKPLIKKIHRILKKQQKYLFFKLILQNFYSVAVLNEISKEIDRIKELNNIVPIGELNKKISSILQKEEGNFIFERLGVRYTNFFIDEFQDTSLLQWKNLLPLIENSIADSSVSSSVTIVGDPKQAIYRWRGGDVNQFLYLQGLANVSSHQKAYKMQNVYLKNNYRSKDELVEFNNLLFSSIGNQIKDNRYSNLFKRLRTKKTIGSGGFVSLEYLENGILYDENQKIRCLKTIKDLKKEGFKYSDLCVLTRTKEKVALIVKMLSNENIPVISHDSLLLTKSPEICFIIHFLRFLNQPNEPQHRFKIFEYLEKKTVFKEVVKDVHNSIVQFCDTNEKAFDYFIKQHIPNFNRINWCSKPLIELCHKIIKSFELNKYNKIYIQFFLEEVWEYGKKYTQNLFSFLEYWESRADKFSITIPEGVNAVQVMTIHKSKGLEFPVVLFPFANWNSKTERNSKSWIQINEPELNRLSVSLLPLSKKLNGCSKEVKTLYNTHCESVVLDNLNLLYVTLTRPKNRLYIFTSLKDRNKNLSNYFDFFLKEQNLWVDGKKKYFFGKKISPPEVKNEINPFVIGTENINHSKTHNLKSVIMWNVDKSQKEINLSQKFHKILSYIKTSKDINPAIRKAIRKNIISSFESSEIVKILIRIVKNSEASSFFCSSLNVKNEKEILLKNGKTIRLDKIVIKDKEVRILDYKIGRKKPEDRKQIINYKSEIELMGYQIKECALLYINKKSIVFEHI